MARFGKKKNRRGKFTDLRKKNLALIPYLLFPPPPPFPVVTPTADAVYNASGLGYVGKDENGQAQWTGMSNVQVVKIEVIIVQQCIHSSHTFPLKVYFQAR